MSGVYQIYNPINNSGISRVCREGESGKYKGKYKNFKWKYF